MKTSDFDFELPERLIAQYPTDTRSASRLLCLERSGAMAHRQFIELPQLLNDKDLLVFNDTKVVKARLVGQKESGGRVEVLVERVIEGDVALAHVRSSRSPKPGTLLYLGESPAIEVEMVGRRGELFELTLRQGAGDFWQAMEQAGHLPLPPYIERDDSELDLERYQTVFAQNRGAVAAPTAGLHFDQALLQRLRERSVSMAQVTLHVGAGTFQPVRAESLTEHRMHAEWISVNRELCEAVAQCKQRGGRVIAVGTTSVRSLESAAQSGSLQPYEGDTDIFIYPGYEFRVVDGMITNFHLPKSTLLMLVSAFAGRDNILKAYREAVAREYRFFSYGDAMLLL